MDRDGKDRGQSDSAILQEKIIEQIRVGDLLPGEKLRSERAMAEFYDVSRGAVQYAMNRLVEQGYLYRRPGSGTFVKERNRSVMNLEYQNEVGNSGVTAMLKNAGARMSNRVLTCGRIQEPAFARKLQMPEGKEVYVLHRVRFANDEAFAVEYSAIPFDLFPDAEGVDFSKISLYDYMDARKHMPVAFNQRFKIIEASEREGGLLGLRRNEPVFHFEFSGYDRDGRAVEYTESYVRCDRTELRFNTRVR